MHLGLWVLPGIYEYGDIDVWRKVSGAFGAFRLPVLFALSGFLVADRVRAGWQDRRNALRAASSYYLYVIWLAVYAILTAVLPGREPVGVSLRGFFKQLVLPQTPLWFVFFLALCVVLYTSLHRVHPAIVLIGAALVSYASIEIALPGQFAMVERGLYYLFFFGVGVYGKKILIYFGSHKGLWWRAPVLVVVALVARDIFWRVPGSAFSYTGAIFLRDLSAIICVVAIMSAVCMVAPLSHLLGFIGRRTLPIYVMHVPIIWMLLLAQDLYMPAMDVFAVRLVFPILAITVIFVVSIGLHAALTRIKVGRLLFDMPSTVSHKILAEKGRGSGAAQSRKPRRSDSAAER